MSQVLFSKLQRHVRQGLLGAGLMLLCGSASAAETAALPDPSRGELLYATHCISCHKVDVHWRNKRLVTDRNSLRREVQRWQEAAGLGWSEHDMEDVARYLDIVYYSNPTPK